MSAHYLVLASPSFLFQVKQSDSNHADPICAFQSEDEGITHPVWNGGIRFLSGFVSLSLWHSSSSQKKSSHALELNHLDGPVCATSTATTRVQGQVVWGRAANTPMLTAPGEVTIGFGYPTPPPQADLPTFTSHPVSNSLTSTPFWPEGVSLLPVRL